jgi:hypothetical protein
MLAALVFLWLVVPAFAQEVTSEDTDDGTRILIDGELFCEVLTGPESRYGDLPRPILYPIIGPTGATMTRGYPMRDDIEGEAHDHPHHRSLWFAHGDVNGVDFWAQGEHKGRVVLDEAIEFRRRNTDVAFVNLVANFCSSDGSVILESTQTHAFHVMEDGSRVIELIVGFFPGDNAGPVTFGDTKEGTMAIRTHPALRLVGEHATGHAVNSEGDTDRELWGKRAAWVAYWGTIDGAVCGVAIFDHPENLRHPTWWHARDYGLIAANPFGIHDFEGAEPGTGDYTLEWGETLTLRYRFVFFAGDAEEADIAGKYEQWVAETMANDDQQPDHEAE